MGIDAKNDGCRETDANSLYGEKRHRVFQLGISDIPAIMELEMACWSPEIRVNEKTLLQRFDLGHIVLGLYSRSKLIGVTAFSYSQSVEPTLSLLPKTFKEFSSQTHHERHGSAFVYNFNVHPDYRGTTMTRRLIFAGVSRLIKDGCDYLIGVARCPSYNGSLHTPFEYVEYSPQFQALMNDHLLRGTTPPASELTADPLLRFYHRVLGCDFLGVVPDFLSGDEPSGGLGVVFCKRLHKGERP
jgi:hypothetical protein